MKTLIYFSLCILLFSCKKDKDDPTPPLQKESLTINYYKPEIRVQEDAPQFTIKNDKIQFSAIGTNGAGRYSHTDKIYISDKDSKTEWIALINENAFPEFLYCINTSTREKMPGLLWFTKDANNKLIVRAYEYDWQNRLGTLSYEAESDGAELKVIFENTSSISAARIKNANLLNLPSSKKTSARSFPSPISRFDQLNSDKNSKNKNRTSAEDLDTDLQEFLQELKDLKEMGIKASCRVSKILNKPDKSFTCKLADILDKYVNENLFNDVKEVEKKSEESGDFDYHGSSQNYDVEVFDSFDNIENDDNRHFNRIRDLLPDVQSIKDWFSNLTKTADTEVGDLDDLTDSKGVLHIALSWNTSNTDIDLHVTDPYGAELYYANPNSSSGGYLDRDDVDGFGPENIYWRQNIPEGNYSISLVYYDPENGPFTDYTVTVIDGLGTVKKFTGGLGFWDGNKVPIVTFRRIGNKLVFN